MYLASEFHSLAHVRVSLLADDKDVPTESAADLSGDACAISRFAGEEGILRAILALERRNFCKADAWTGSETTLFSFFLAVGISLCEANLTSYSARQAGILEKEVERRNTFLLYATITGKVWKEESHSCAVFTSRLRVHFYPGSSLRGRAGGWLCHLHRPEAECAHLQSSRRQEFQATRHSTSSHAGEMHP